MKRRFGLVLALIIISILAMTGCKKKDGLIEITLNEVAHSVFYAPMYVAFEKGYFEDEGLKVNLVNGLGADKTMTALLAGECEIGFMGSEASIYVYNQGADDYVVNSPSLPSMRATSVWGHGWCLPDNLRGKVVLGGRKRACPNGLSIYSEKRINREDLTIQNIDSD